MLEWCQKELILSDSPVLPHGPLSYAWGSQDSLRHGHHMSMFCHRLPVLSPPYNPLLNHNNILKMSGRVTPTTGQQAAMFYYCTK